MKPLEPLPSQQSAPPTPTLLSSPQQPGLSCAAGRRPSPPATIGRRPAGGPANTYHTAEQPKTASPLQANIHFDEQARQIVVALIKPDTQEVVRQIPPEKILKLIVDLRLALERRFDRQA